MCQSRWRRGNGQSLALLAAPLFPGGGGVLLSWQPAPSPSNSPLRWWLEAPWVRGLWPERVPCHPGWPSRPLPQPAPPAQSSVSGPWGRPGHPFGIGMPEVAAARGGGGAISSETGAVLAAAGRPHPCAACHMSPKLRLQLVRAARFRGGCYFGDGGKGA